MAAAKKARALSPPLVVPLTVTVQRCQLCGTNAARASGMCSMCERIATWTPGGAASISSGLPAPVLTHAPCAHCGQGTPNLGSRVCVPCGVRKMLCTKCGASTQVTGGPICAKCTKKQLRQRVATQGVKPAASAPLPRDDLRLVDLIGWRIWRVTGSAYLRSLTAETIWLPGEPMEAAEVSDHGVAKDGIHVFMERAGAVKEMAVYLEVGRGAAANSLALGSVLLWGDVVEHERGYRAERAKVLSIEDVVWEGKPPWAEETKRALAFLRERYGVAG